MIALQYSLVIEATEDPNVFSFYSPDLEGFTGVGNSVEDCLYKARWGMQEHVALLREQGLPCRCRSMTRKLRFRTRKRSPLNRVAEGWTRDSLADFFSILPN